MIPKFRGDGNVDVYTSLSGNDFYTVGEGWDGK